MLVQCGADFDEYISCMQHTLCPPVPKFQCAAVPSSTLACMLRPKRPHTAVYSGMPQAALASEAIATVGHTMRAMNGEEGARRAAITQGLRGAALAYGTHNKESARLLACVLGWLRGRGF